MNKIKSISKILPILIIGAIGVQTIGCSSDGDNSGDGTGGGNGENSNSNGGSNDIKGYKTVVIGTQTWMAENLNYEVQGSVCYGEAGEEYTADGNYITLSNGEIQANCKKYGRLYSQEAAMNACPSGWHLPSLEEWNTLIKYVGIDNAGLKLKAKSGWNNNDDGSSGNGTDNHGFSALPGGGKFYYGVQFPFRDIGAVGKWWTKDFMYSCDDTGCGLTDKPFAMLMGNYRNDVKEDWDPKESLLSVRCIKNASSTNPPSANSSSSNANNLSSSSGGSSPSLDCSDYQYQYDARKRDLSNYQDKLKDEQDAYNRMVSAGYSSSVLNSQQMLIQQIQKNIQDTQSLMSQISSQARNAGCSVY